MQTIDDTRRILQAMEKATDDVANRRAILDALSTGSLTAQQMFELGRRFQACEAADEAHLRKDWGNEEQGGWFGEIMDQVNRGFVQALQQLGDEPSRRLRVDWIKRQGATFHIEINSTARGVTMRIVTPIPTDPLVREHFLAK
jgi:hypothetical protein